MNKSFLLISFLFIALLLSCDHNVLEDPPSENSNADSLKIVGTGVIKFNEYEPLRNKEIPVYYNIPNNANSRSPVLILIHGADRQADYIRDIFIQESNRRGFIIIAPEFNETDFPGGDAFNLGNIFKDGDNPSTETLNPESQWTFSVIEPIFQYMKSLIGSSQNTYDIFGHSAGGQFVHRLALFVPNINTKRIISAASGWYTIPDTGIQFPYGLSNSPGSDLNFMDVFSKELYILIGTEDNDPDAPGLRHNNFADAQGLDRLSRAQFFYSTSEEIAKKNAVSYNWKLNLIPTADHNLSYTAQAAINILYP